MICLGYPDDEKRAAIARYQSAHDIRKTVVISADDFPLPVPDTDQVKYSDVIMYVTFYRLLQEIDRRTLVVLNECLRTQNRYDLAYNCIRNYLNQTEHALVFQFLPQIDTAEDFMALFDWATRSRWKRRAFDADLILRETQVSVRRHPLAFTAVPVATSARTRARYAAEREKLFRELGNRDPHMLPRQLYLLGGADKADYIRGQALPLFASGGGRYVARNQRLGLAQVVSYAQAGPPAPYTLVELPHRFIDFADFLMRTGQTASDVLVADLKVDAWYFQRYTDWMGRLNDTYASLSQ